MAIIKSILDNDLYKFTMQQAVLELFPDTKVKYKFKNRGKEKFNRIFLNKFKKEIEKLEKLSLTNKEYNFLKNNCKFLKPQYLEFLKNYRYKKNEVIPALDKDNNLILSIEGYWYSTILWEVPLLSLISELYYKYVDKNWNFNIKKQFHLFNEKINKLTINECKFADFGTRRRRSYENQNNLICNFKKYNTKYNKKYFVGTSNVYLSKKYDLKPIGTMAHEWIQAMQSLESINHCNYFALQNWVKVYNSQLGIALTDTVKTDMFFKNFNRRMSMLYDGIRHDSGDPFIFTEKTIKHYKDMNINPMYKTIIFSDGLNIDKAIKIKKYCEGKINCSFGIGTHFTNDGFKNNALNIVTKLYSVNNFPVVKLSDVEGKENGNQEAIKNMKWIVNNQLKK